MTDRVVESSVDYNKGVVDGTKETIFHMREVIRKLKENPDINKGHAKVLSAFLLGLNGIESWAKLYVERRENEFGKGSSAE